MSRLSWPPPRPLQCPPFMQHPQPEVKPTTDDPEMMILNLTQHLATKEQVNAGVIDLPESQRQQLNNLLTFDGLPSSGEVQQRAANIAYYAQEWMVQFGIAFISGHAVMIGGAPYLMCPLERFLTEAGFIPVYAYSQRESFEEKQPDGSVRKVNTFRHAGFVPATYNLAWSQPK